MYRTGVLRHFSGNARANMKNGDRKGMDLIKRECGIRLHLVPRGAGWSDVHADFGTGEMQFIISHVLGGDFETFMAALCALHPDNTADFCLPHLIRYKFANVSVVDGVEQITSIDDEPKGEYILIPWMAKFDWDEEGSESYWILEREPNFDTEFDVKIKIELCRDETTFHEFNVPYADLCYAAAAAYTRAMKKHGLCGYHSATQGSEEINFRVLLMLKSIALGCADELRDSWSADGRQGGSTDIEKELELLCFDM